MLDEYSQLRITTFIVSCLSTIANIVIMITCHRHPVIGQTLSRKLIYYQTLADLIGNISFIFLSPYHTIQCNILGIFIFIMNISCVFWTVIMSFVLQLVTNVNRNPIFPASKYFTYYHIFCWIFPSILSLLPYFHGGYEKVNSAWCFIRDLKIRIILFYVPIWISIVYIAISTVITKSQLNNMSFGGVKKQSSGYSSILLPLITIDFGNVTPSTSKSGKESIALFASRLKYYPICLVICFFPITFCRTLEFFMDPSATLLIISVVFFRLQGVCALILFALSDSVRQAWTSDLEILYLFLGTTSLSRLLPTRSSTQENPETENDAPQGFLYSGQTSSATSLKNDNVSEIEFVS